MMSMPLLSLPRGGDTDSRSARRELQLHPVFRPFLRRPTGSLCNAHHFACQKSVAAGLPRCGSPLISEKARGVENSPPRRVRSKPGKRRLSGQTQKKSSHTRQSVRSCRARLAGALPHARPFVDAAPRRGVSPRVACAPPGTFVRERGVDTPPPLNSAWAGGGG